MSTKFQRNAVLSGYMHSYCLVCDFFFESQDGILDHLEEENHAEQLLAFPYMEKYAADHIRKVNRGYFCEFCSILFATAAKISLHIKEKSHIDNKSLCLLHRSNGVITAFDDIIISENAWHGFDNDTCAICNIEYTNQGIHKTEPGHLLNLVQNKVEFGANNSVYRKMDDDSFQCLTCNSVFSLNTINEHFKDSQHKELYSKCQQEMKNHTQKADTTKKEKHKEKKVDNNQNVKKETKKVDNNQNVAKKETKKTDNNQKKETETVVEDEVTIYAKENNLTYKVGNANASCKLCEMKVPSSLRCLKEHVNGKEHKSRLAKSLVKTQTKPKSTMTRRAMSKFINHVVTVENVLHTDEIINDRYCLTQLSYFMIINLGSRYRCQVCEVNIVYVDEIDDHVKEWRHKEAMDDTPVITSLPSNEFVREIRPDIFHCGYCNLASKGEEELSDHLRSGAHREAREASNWRLQRHLPEVRRYRQRRDEDILKMMILGHMFN